MKTKNKNIIFEIALASIFLSLGIMMNYLSSFVKFPIAPFLSFHFLLIVSFVCLYTLGYKWSITILLLYFLIVPLIWSQNDLAISYLGNLIVLLSNFFFIGIYILFYHLFIKFFKSKLNSNNLNLENLTESEIGELNLKRLHKNEFYSFFSAAIISIIISTFLLSTLNTFLFNVLYFKLFRTLDTFTLSELVSKYDVSFKAFFLGMNNYYGGSYTLYIIFNLINYSINLVPIAILFSLEVKIKLFSRVRKQKEKNRY